MTDTASGTINPSLPQPAPLGSEVVLASVGAVVVPVKPGWQTTEFWGAWAVKIFGALLGSGVLGDGTMATRVVGCIMTVLALLGYTASRTAIKSAAGLALFFALATQPACHQSTRLETLQAAQLSIGAARDSLAAYDQMEQDEIVATATTLEVGKAKLANWRTKRNHLTTLVAAAFRAVAIAGELNDQPSLDTAKLAVGQVIDAIQAVLSGGTP